MIKQAITKNSLLLTSFALVVAASLAATELYTRESRAESIRNVQSRALEEIIPADLHDNVMLDDFIETGDQEFLKLKQQKKIHIARLNGEVVAFIIPARAPDGYGGAIDSIIGINTDGTIAGVRVITHQETPGLGDKVELKKSHWVLSFEGKSLNEPQANLWKVKKDRGIFDQFTGATITPRAVVKSIYNTLLFYQENKEQLLAKANNTATATEATTPQGAQ